MVVEKFYREVAEDVIMDARAEHEAHRQAETVQVTPGNNTLTTCHSEELSLLAY